MSDSLLGLCLALVIAGAALRLRTGMDLSRMRVALEELKQERQELRGQRAQAQTALEIVEVQERELNNDVRDLAAELSAVNQRNAELRAEEAEVRRRAEQRGTAIDREGEDDVAQPAS